VPDKPNNVFNVGHSVPNLRDIIRQHSLRLETALSLDPGSARIEVQCLLQFVLQQNRAYLLSHPEDVLDAEQQARYAALFERRLNGEPIAYLLGEREFFGLNFKVTQATLIPRQDTELLVELALQRFPSPQPSTAQGGGSLYRVLDLGTGSGAVALSIAHARPDAVVTAADISNQALAVAGENAQRLNIGNVRLLCSDWFAELHHEHYDLIVANPPYIACDDAHLMQGDLRFEPRAALASGVDGLDDIRRIAAQAAAHLNDHGWLLLEHGHDQAARVRDLLRQSGFVDVFSARDLAGIERVSGGQVFSHTVCQHPPFPA